MTAYLLLFSQDDSAQSTQKIHKIRCPMQASLSTQDNTLKMAFNIRQLTGDRSGPSHHFSTYPTPSNIALLPQRLWLQLSCFVGSWQSSGLGQYRHNSYRMPRIPSISPSLFQQRLGTRRSVADCSTTGRGS